MPALLLKPEPPGGGGPPARGATVLSTPVLVLATVLATAGAAGKPATEEAVALEGVVAFVSSCKMPLAPGVKKTASSVSKPNPLFQSTRIGILACVSHLMSLSVSPLSGYRWHLGQRRRQRQESKSLLGKPY